MVADFRRRFWVCLGLTAPILLLAPMIQGWLGIREAFRFPGSSYVLFGLATAVFLYGGWPFLKGLGSEIKDREPGMMTLIGVAILIAYAYSAAVVLGVTGRTFFWELATLIDVMLLGHWIEMKSVMGASRAMEKLASLMPSEAHRLTDEGGTEEVPLSELRQGDRIRIKPGEKIPADGNVEEGRSSVNESMISGESKPVDKAKGDEVVGGSVNGDGSLTVKVARTGDDSYLAQVMDMVKKARESRSRGQDLANRAAAWLTGIALAAGAITFVVWLFVVQRDVQFSLERTVTVMVITYPHALGLAVPLVVAVSTALGAGRGLLIRNRTAFERSRNMNAIVFDKTGTLTEGRFTVTNVVPLQSDRDPDEALRLAAGVEAHSEHPIARGITDQVDEPPAVEDFEAITGSGVKGRVEGRSVMVVSRSYLEEQQIKVSQEQIESLEAEGKTVVYVLVDEQPAAAIVLGDVLREDSATAVKRFKEMGVQCMMLTGDNRQAAQWVANELGLDDFFAEVRPEEKAEKIKEVQSRGLLVAMAGDGINDAPALAQADIGIAIGAGTDVAIESADIILVNSNPKDALEIVALARATYRKIVQNLIWASGYNVFAIPLAAGVLYPVGFVLNPAVGAIIMSASTIIVAINARLLRVSS
jgi:Cu2+-exporting ATPase